MPRHVQDRKDASALVELYAANDPVRDFYAALVAHADANMRLDVELWDEGDDEWIVSEPACLRSMPQWFPTLQEGTCLWPLWAKFALWSALSTEKRASPKCI
jgi:hypothetical protein